MLIECFLCTRYNAECFLYIFSIFVMKPSDSESFNPFPNLCINSDSLIKDHHFFRLSNLLQAVFLFCFYGTVYFHILMLVKFYIFVLNEIPKRFFYVIDLLKEKSYENIYLFSLRGSTYQFKFYFY